jgi:tRNA-2-methylthio-N6-dimethylallyladenosine synthase
VLDHSAVQKHRERIGRIEEVIVEGRNKRDEEKWTGRTRQNKLVHFSSNEMFEPCRRLSIIVDA